MHNKSTTNKSNKINIFQIREGENTYSNIKTR